jgi:hypothetical protein
MAGGDRKALEALFPLVYKELRRLAHFQLRNERPNHTLQSAALVHEAYFRLVGMSRLQWESTALWPSILLDRNCWDMAPGATGVK